MLAEMKPGSVFIVLSVASTSMSTSFCWFSGLTVKTLTRVSTSRPLRMVGVVDGGMVDLLPWLIFADDASDERARGHIAHLLEHPAHEADVHAPLRDLEVLRLHPAAQDERLTRRITLLRPQLQPAPP